MKKPLSLSPRKKDILSPVLLLLLTALFFLLHYNVFVNGFYRPHGDFTGIHFSASYILNAVFRDLDLPVWQPYQGLGNVDILSYLAYHPLITAVSAAAQAAVSALPGSGYSFFRVTFFAFLLGYCATFAFGCYLLAKDLLTDRFARLSVYAMALFGTHIFFTVYSLTSGIFYLPFLLIFLFRMMSGEKPALTLAGIILALGLFLSSNTSYFGQAATMLILLFGAAALLWPGGITGFKKLFQTSRASAVPVYAVGVSAALAAAMLALKAVLTFRLGEFASAHRTIAAKSSYIQNNLAYLESVSLKVFTNHISPLFENLANGWTNSPLQEYSPFPRLYYGLFPFAVLLLFWRRIKSPVLPLLLALTLSLFLASTNPRDGYNFILPLMVYLNPLLSMSTRHLNFPVIFAAPFLILAFGLALDALLREKTEGVGSCRPSFPVISALLLAVFASAHLQKGKHFARHCADILPVSLLIIYFPAERFPKLRLLPGLLALLLISAELLTPFSKYTRTFFDPFGKERAQGETFGPNLDGPELRGFPSPFTHSFSFRFDDKGLVTTANNYPAQNNAAFKFFSSSRPELFNLPGLFIEDMPYLRGNNERLFFVDKVVPARDQAENLELTAAIYKNGLHLSAAAVETLGDSTGLPAIAVGAGPGSKRAAAPPQRPGPPDRSVFLQAASFTRDGKDGKDPSVKLYTARLPAEFPSYLTSNFLNADSGDIELTGGDGRIYAATYFDSFDGEKMFQANFRTKNRITISGPPPGTGLTLKWRDRFSGLGINVAGFGYNYADFTVKRKSAGFLVYMDRFHPRWRASIDGKQVRIYRANGQFKGVLVPEGNHDVKFEYRDPVLKLALAVSTLAHLLGAALLFILCLRVRP